MWDFCGDAAVREAVSGPRSPPRAAAASGRPVGAWPGPGGGDRPSGPPHDRSARSGPSRACPGHRSPPLQGPRRSGRDHRGDSGSRPTWPAGPPTPGTRRGCCSAAGSPAGSERGGSPWSAWGCSPHCVGCETTPRRCSPVPGRPARAPIVGAAHEQGRDLRDAAYPTTGWGWGVNLYAPVPAAGHGADGVLTIWTETGELIYRVEDTGRIGDPVTGASPPAPRTCGGQDLRKERKATH
jgi:hypothetical protein